MNTMLTIKVDSINLLAIYFFFLDSSCRTRASKGKKNPDANRACIFPFKYQGKEFGKCTTYKNSGALWCATEVSSDGSYVPYSGKWGKCTKECTGNKYNTGTLTENNVL